MKAGQDVFVALDVASSELWAGGGKYVFKKSGEADRTSEQMVRLYEDWLRQYPIASIEDGVAEGDWDRLAAADARARRPRPAGGRRCVRHQPGDSRPRDCRRRRQRAARQAEPDRHRHRNARCRPDGEQRAATPRSSRTGPAKPRIPRLPTSRSGPAPVRSRRVRRAGPTGSANTISCCGSKRSWAGDARFAGRGAIRALGDATS